MAKTDLAGMIEVKDLEMGKLSWVIQVHPIMWLFKTHDAFLAVVRDLEPPMIRERCNVSGFEDGIRLREPGR